ncbi:polyprenyl diphosphate synthase [Permianibacter aggregans]|uniref:Ditrans,polycis-undecaprenyl-diphosphate synthase ((2E,6E)-farnesyl-diphosphate specific) n=1 Tax=Permianibacter aggregans TaxID=1510150 RepID=A0A4R6UY64_9GAMM|nr:polyprenyl diphosphate synthase [Permianibacter aggregans]TDQ50535.1 undecaprenyl pyrophosphate synthetase [Permianibacter aggregans]
MTNQTEALPRHVAIIMDGNGRWARKRGLPRVAGHKVGMERAREITEAAGKRGVKALTLFAFSSENWQRPEDEVSYLMDLFVTGLEREAKALHKNNVRLRVIGDRSRFSAKLQQRMLEAEAMTADNTALNLNIAANYGGRWDIVQAVSQHLQNNPGISQVSEQDISDRVQLHDEPPLDLLIRTGGEIRISNFLLWQAAYAELYFSDVLWPDFHPEELDKALAAYAQRQRRYGKTGEQVTGESAQGDA